MRIGFICQSRHCQLEFLNKGLGVRQRVLGSQVDGQHYQAIRLVSLIGGLQSRHFLAAGGTPTGPEIKNYRLSSQLGKGYRCLTVKGF